MSLWDDYVREHGQGDYEAWLRYIQKMRDDGHEEHCAVFCGRDCDCHLKDEKEDA